MSANISGSNLKIKVPADRIISETRFCKSFFDLLPASHKILSSNEEDIPEEVLVSGPNPVQMTLFAIRSAVNRELRWLKSSYRSCLVKRGLDTSKREYLQMRVNELMETAPDSDEMISLQNEMIAMDQYEMRLEGLRRVIDDLSDYMKDVKSLEDSLKKICNPLNAGGEIENLFSDICGRATEAEGMASGLL